MSFTHELQKRQYYFDLLKCTVRYVYIAAQKLQNWIMLEIQIGFSLDRQTTFLSRSNKNPIEEGLHLGARCGAHDWLVLKDGLGPPSPLPSPPPNMPKAPRVTYSAKLYPNRTPETRVAIPSLDWLISISGYIRYTPYRTPSIIQIVFIFHNPGCSSSPFYAYEPTIWTHSLTLTSCTQTVFCKFCGI